MPIDPFQDLAASIRKESPFLKSFPHLLGEEIVQDQALVSLNLSSIHSFVLWMRLAHGLNFMENGLARTLLRTENLWKLLDIQ